ncbi:MAG: metallophosphoesterase [Candidatus Acetothermia bacterium]|jgi:putative SbcD/Mre11-related phosphoesterase|nr:metallophosphoesterase [Candidatus Acetothermia bacterium]MDH7504853.1 metallophosphoesterase [Candidatus Acetothermia bacterium]
MEPLELFPDLWLIDLAVYLPKRKTLVIADLHLGYEEALRLAGVALPPGHLRKVEARLERLLSRAGPVERLIINGDLKHRFAPLSRYEEREAVALLRFLGRRFAELILVRGNHDKNVESLLRAAPQLQVREALVEDGLVIIHGDREPSPAELAAAESILIGHDHPAVGLRSRAGRVEAYKAFLLGEYRGRRLLVQPSFNLLVCGTDLTRERTLSPLLDDERLAAFQVYPVSDEGAIYSLGPLGSLLRP